MIKDKVIEIIINKVKVKYKVTKDEEEYIKKYLLKKLGKI